MTQSQPRPDLSIVVPVYNERQTLPDILPRVVRALPHLRKEIVLVDDGSNDGTREWLTERFGVKTGGTSFVTCDEQGKLVDAPPPPFDPPEAATRDVARACRALEPAGIKVLFQPSNQGKGAALRRGFTAASADVLVVQDADLEYDPRDWEKMWPLIDEGWADIVYGSRFYGEPHRALYFHHFLGNKLISNLINMLWDVTLSDIEVCYKMFRREVLDGVQLTCSDFGFEVEFTIKVAAQKRWRLYEVGISYYGRTYEEGKKINWKDGLKALGYIARFRLQR